MTTMQRKAGLHPSGNVHCPRCSTVLPAAALFCPVCGERMNNEIEPAPPGQDETAARYQPQTLLCRRGSVALSLAVDTLRLRPVVIRDIDVSLLDEHDQAQAYDIVVREYDQLRRLSTPVPLLMPAIDTDCVRGHLLTIMSDATLTSQAVTLNAALGSGIGLPTVSVALTWGQHLCETLEELHRSKIFIGDLDPRVILLRSKEYTQMPALLISWLPPALSGMLPPASPREDVIAFTAPEALDNRLDARSDVYSLGALLYLLLTGQPPEISEGSLRPPGELNAEVSREIDAVVMRALSPDPALRYQSMWDMQGILIPLNAKSRLRVNGKFSRMETSASGASAAPVVVASRIEDVPASEFPSSPTITPLPVGEQDEPEERSFHAEAEGAPMASSRVIPFAESEADGEDSEITITVPPRIVDAMRVEDPAPPVVSLPAEIPASRAIVPYRAESRSALMHSAERLLRRLRDMLLGEQRLETTAAAIIETPLRVQPDQTYTLRIQLMGRGSHGAQVAARKNWEAPGGLSSLTQGTTVLIEVRSAIYERYAYVVQQAAVAIPAAGYAAEITIPLRSLSQGPSGRRDRLHIFFLDEQRRPLYDKPFVVELFISHRVQPGREGHNVLTLPY